jgi:hypothetical protein
LTIANGDADLATTTRVLVTMVKEYRRNTTHVHRSIAGEHLLMGLQRGATEPFLSMSETAAVLWDRLERWSTAHQLAEHLLAEYDVEEPTARADVDRFLEQLVELGAVDSREAGE